MVYVSTKPYPYLPQGRSIEYVQEDNQFMAQAALARRELSTDDLHPIGAVVVKDGLVIGRGGNQSALKNKTLREFHRKYFCVRRLFRVPSGKMYWLCPGCASSSSHSEPMALKDALSRNHSIAGAGLYLYGHWWCCEPCWKKMLDAGIKNVYLVEGATEKFSKSSTSFH